MEGTITSAASTCGKKGEIAMGGGEGGCALNVKVLVCSAVSPGK